MKRVYLCVMMIGASAAGCGAVDALLAALDRGAGPITFSITLSGDQEVPPVDTDASGAATFTLSADRSKLAYEILASGLGTRFTVSHFYNAAAGENGPVVYAVADSLRQTGETLTGSGVWPLREIDLQELLAGRIYLKIHTFAHPASELRGQLIVPME